MARVSLQSMFDQARRSIEANDPERAIGLAEHILTEWPQSLEAYRILGEAYLASRQLDRAQNAFERVLQSDPENIPAHVGLGITFERQGRLDRAVPEFEQALEIKPDVPELRSQLLRLYADAWGNEHAQLRLSRAGLARLYAKGHMLPQAIAELNQVVEEQPHRLDTKVALAEALWGDGRIDEAQTTCREILAQHPEALKPNLILGYLHLKAGKSEGQTFWDTATKLDPYQAVARTMFDQLPVASTEEPTSTEWNEVEWHNRREQEQQQQVAATRPMEVALVPPSDPVETIDDWFEPRVLPAIPAAAVAARAIQPEDDNFLANLLAINSAPPIPVNSASNADLDLDIDLPPFSLDDLDEKPTPSSGIVSTDQPDLVPLSLKDLGLSDEEIAELEPTPKITAQLDIPEDIPLPASAEPKMEPFSLADLGLTDEDMAALDLPPEPTASTTVEPVNAVASDEPNMTPFSLADLGLTDEDMAALDLPPEPTAPTTVEPGAAVASDEPNMTPFSLADLGLTDEDMAALDLPPEPTAPTTVEPGAAVASDEPSMTPFSLADLGLTDEDMAALDLPPEPAAQASNTSAPSEIEDLGLALETGAIQPFSFEDLGLSDEEIAALNDLDTTGDVAPTIASGSTAQNLLDEAPTTQALPPVDNIENISDALASGQIAPFSFADLGLSEEEIAALNAPSETITPATSAQAPTELQPFAFDEASLANLNDLTNEQSDFPNDAELKPFSMAELGLSEEEIASFDELTAEPKSGSLTTSDTDLGFSLDDNLDIQPFSMDDLGLSSALEGLNDPFGMSTSIPPSTGENLSNFGSGELPPDLQPFSLDELDQNDGDLGSNLPASLQPFSLEDSPNDRLPRTAPRVEAPLASELSDDDEQTNANTGYSWQQPTQRSRPSFLDAVTGLGDAEATSIFAKLKQRRQSEQLPELNEPAPTDLSGEDALHANLFSQDNISLRDEPPPTQPMLTGIAGALASQVSARTNETASHVETAETIEQGFASGEMEPFSLADLGLSVDEIAALGIGEPIEATQVEPQDSVAPFTFSELGLSEAGVEALDLDLEVPPPTEAPTAQTPPPPSTPSTASANISEALQSGEIKPFSFADLGLSEEEIAALGLEIAEPNAPTLPPFSSTSADTFSIGDLDLIDEPTSNAESELPSTNAEQPAVAEFDSFLSDILSPETPVAPPEAQTQPAVEETFVDDQVKPFSMFDLGLSDEDLADFDQADDERGLGITEEELANLGLDQFQWDDPSPTATTLGSSSQPVADFTPLEGNIPAELKNDPLLARLITLGRKQGFVDISDIIAGVENPEAEADRIEQIGQVLHEARIEIRDGDEVIDMDAEYEDDYPIEAEQPSATPITTADTPEDMSPFSLAELGLSDDEIASLSFDSIQPTPPVDETPSMTPFSLAELGLSDEEIASLNQLDVTGKATDSALDFADLELPPVTSPPVTPPPVTPPPVTPPQPVASKAASAIETVLSDIPGLETFESQLSTDPTNHSLRLALARMVTQAGAFQVAAKHYRQLIKQGAMLDDIVEDLQFQIEDENQPESLRQMHRLLGDVYSKQGRFQEAMVEYNWTIGNR
jgi:tetratricopeptide (TPR) repeat protein